MSNHSSPVSPPGALTVALDCTWAAAMGVAAALMVATLVTFSAPMFIGSLAAASVGVGITVVEALRARRYGEKVGQR
jgi:hypothetical protein